MHKVNVQEAVGMVLCHDITRIIPGKYKGRAFKKGHIIAVEDVPQLQELGKEHIYVWEPSRGMVHENEAAERIAAAVTGPGIELTQPDQGKVSLVAGHDGLLKVHTPALEAVNSVEQIVLATLHNHYPVKKGQVVAGTRVIPLLIEEEKVRRVEQICRPNHGLIEVKPLHQPVVGLVTTGNEVYSGRVRDGFGPAVGRKIEEYHGLISRQVFVPDDALRIAGAITKLAEEGNNLIIVTGGMSVDPDDVTPLGIRLAGAEVVSYGAPVLPGSMSLVAYLGKIPVLGLLGCVMYAKTTVFDLLLPRILAGEKITRQDLLQLGHGGLCLECPTCSYPACAFGKGC